MHESDTYLAILDEGQEKHAKKVILLFGEKRLGPPDGAFRSRLEEIHDLDRLDRMLCKAVEAISWQEILDTP
jgi:hypothetical protein